MFKRVFYTGLGLGAGLVAGVYVVRKIEATQRKLTPEHLAARAGAGAGSLGERARSAFAEGRKAAADREAELRAGYQHRGGQGTARGAGEPARPGGRDVTPPPGDVEAMAWPEGPGRVTPPPGDVEAMAWPEGPGRVAPPGDVETMRRPGGPGRVAQPGGADSVAPPGGRAAEWESPGGVTPPSGGSAAMPPGFPTR